MDNEATKIEGIVHKVMETETFPSGFQKRILVVNTGGQYPQFIPIEWLKDKVTILDGLQEGQTIVVHANIRGNENKGRYYLSLVGWKFSVDVNTMSEMQQQPVQQPVQTQPVQSPVQAQPVQQQQANVEFEQPPF